MAEDVLVYGMFPVFENRWLNTELPRQPLLSIVCIESGLKRSRGCSTVPLRWGGHPEGDGDHASWWRSKLLSEP